MSALAATDDGSFAAALNSPVNPVIEEGSSYRIEQSSIGSTLVVTDTWNADAAAVVRAGRVDGLDLNYAKGFKDTDLAFIEDWPIKRVSLLARTVKDLGPLYRLADTIEVLSVESAPVELDLGRFPRLTDLSAQWPQMAGTLSECPLLESLYIGSYGGDDLTPLRHNAELSKLRMKDRPALHSLAGLGKLQRLRHLGIYMAARLEDFTALEDIELLNELHLEACRSLRDLAPIAAHRSLAILNAAECGDVTSLRPLVGLDQLETIWMFGDTRVLDDDLSPLASLPRLIDLRLKGKESYTPSVEQIQATINTRRSA